MKPANAFSMFLSPGEMNFPVAALAFWVFYRVKIHGLRSGLGSGLLSVKVFWLVFGNVLFLGLAFFIVASQSLSDVSDQITDQRFSQAVTNHRLGKNISHDSRNPRHCAAHSENVFSTHLVRPYRVGIREQSGNKQGVCWQCLSRPSLVPVHPHLRRTGTFVVALAHSCASRHPDFLSSSPGNRRR